MTLDEAIKHCLDVAENNEAKAQKIGVQFLGTTKDREATDCRQCATDHRQLAEWLQELKNLRAENKVLTRDCLRLIKSNEKLRKKLGLIANYKRLLKAAVEDFSEVKSYLSEPYSHLCDKWRYEDEALKLLNDEK